MYCWRNLLKTVGTLLEIENCQMQGQFSQDSQNRVKNHRMDIPGPVRDNKEMNDIQARHFVARNAETYV